MIDIGSDQLDRSLKGLVPDEDVDNLVNAIHANTHGESQAATGAAASNLDLYQVNSTYYSALGCNDQHYIAARAVQFFLPGVRRSTMSARLPARTTWSCCTRPTWPQISNRHYYSTAEIDENLQRPVVKALNALAKFRNELDAFDGTFSYSADGDTSISFTWEGTTTQATLTFEPGRGLGVENTASVATLEWRDAAGEHRTDDLIANPPVVADSASPDPVAA